MENKDMPIFSVKMPWYHSASKVASLMAWAAVIAFVFAKAWNGDDLAGVAFVTVISVAAGVLGNVERG